MINDSNKRSVPYQQQQQPMTPSATRVQNSSVNVAQQSPRMLSLELVGGNETVTGKNTTRSSNTAIDLRGMTRSMKLNNFH